MAIESMKKNVHAFVEVPIATTIEDMWKIIDTSENGLGEHNAEKVRFVPLVSGKT